MLLLQVEVKLLMPSIPARSKLFQSPSASRQILHDASECVSGNGSIGATIAFQTVIVPTILTLLRMKSCGYIRLLVIIESDAISEEDAL